MHFVKLMPQGHVFFLFLSTFQTPLHLNVSWPLDIQAINEQAVYLCRNKDLTK